MKIPIEVKKKLEQLVANRNTCVSQVGEISLALDNAKQQVRQLEHERAQFWAQVCSEYKIDPAANYTIEDDGEVKQTE